MNKQSFDTDRENTFYVKDNEYEILQEEPLSGYKIEELLEEIKRRTEK